MTELNYPEHFLHDIENMTRAERADRCDDLIAFVKLHARLHANPNWVTYYMYELARLAEMMRGNETTGRQCLSPEQEMVNDILTELLKARHKFPGENVTFAALVEEVGELSTAIIEEPRARVRAEAVQVAAMAIRMALDGDMAFAEWRRMKGLDGLTKEGHSE